MAELQSHSLDPLRKLLDSQVAKDLTDGELLARFAGQRDESAFAALMSRHGPLVFGVCRHVLDHEHDAEDAFQGTFLVLARKAPTIRRQGSVAGWLYGVAYRLSLKARQSAARRRRHESRTAKPDLDRSPAQTGWRELQAILDAELARLPEKFRTPFVLCALEGHSKPEAARQLQWQEGTVASRLGRARKLLQVRRARRGVELSAVLCGLAVADQGAQASVPLTLSSDTLQASLAFGAGQAGGAASARAAALARSGLRSMALARLRPAAAVVVLFLVVGASAGTYFWYIRKPEPSPPMPLPGPPGPAPAVVAGDPDKAGPGQILVRGQVTRPDGSPVPGADIALLTDEYREAGDRDFNVFMRRKLVAAGRADADGRFRMVARHPIVGKDH